MRPLLASVATFQQSNVRDGESVALPTRASSMAALAFLESLRWVKRQPDDNMRVDQNHLSSPHSLRPSEGETTSPVMCTLADEKVVDVVGVAVGGDQLARRLCPRLVITTVSALGLHFTSMTARQWILKEPAAIFLIGAPHNHGHYTVVMLCPSAISGCSGNEPIIAKRLDLHQRCGASPARSGVEAGSYVRHECALRVHKLPVQPGCTNVRPAFRGFVKTLHRARMSSSLRHTDAERRKREMSTKWPGCTGKPI